MSLIYRSEAINDKVAEMVVKNHDTIVCVLTDKIRKTEDTIICYNLRQAERLVEQFLHPKKQY